MQTIDSHLSRVAAATQSSQERVSRYWVTLGPAVGLLLSMTLRLEAQSSNGVDPQAVERAAESPKAVTATAARPLLPVDEAAALHSESDPALSFQTSLHPPRPRLLFDPSTEALAQDQINVEARSGAGNAAAPSQAGAREDEGWEFTFTPYLWLPSMSGDSELRGREATVGLTIGDVLQEMELAFMEAFTARKGRWALYHNGFYADLQDETSVLGTDIDTTSKQGMLDLAVAYRVLEDEVHPTEGHTVSLDLFGGIRYQYLKSEIDAEGFAEVDESHDWVEPLIGGFLRFGITRDFAWDAALLDLSGFGVGSASDLTANFYSGIAYRVAEQITLRFGYRLFSLDYSRGSGDDRFSQDLLMNGPVAGVSIAF
ncbi:MAG: hypothetical protein AB1486_16315 [Planctomycetota bacterium]